MPDRVVVRDAHLRALSPEQLYRILALRVDVFVVEQECAYRELDGRDTEPGARQVWAERGDVVVGTLRVLEEADGSVRIGRVATARSARGQGIGQLLVSHALTLAGHRAVVADVQSYLTRWYEKFGFVVDGAEFVEDGIAHVPMRRVGPSSRHSD
jgi:ElaA protein